MGVLVRKKNSKTLLCMTFEKEPGPCLSLQYCFLLLLPCLYISSLICNWNYPLELRGGHECWMKLISYKQEIGAQKIFWAQEPHRVLCGFNIKSELYTIRFKILSNYNEIKKTSETNYLRLFSQKCLRNADFSEKRP